MNLCSSMFCPTGIVDQLSLIHHSAHSFFTTLLHNNSSGTLLILRKSLARNISLVLKELRHHESIGDG